MGEILQLGFGKEILHGLTWFCWDLGRRFKD
jgi:hypothetical protein